MWSSEETSISELMELGSSLCRCSAVSTACALHLSPGMQGAGPGVCSTRANLPVLHPAFKEGADLLQGLGACYQCSQLMANAAGSH